MIHDMIGYGMMWGDVMITKNCFTFSFDSQWHMTKSVVLDL